MRDPGINTENDREREIFIEIPGSTLKMRERETENPRINQRREIERSQGDLLVLVGVDCDPSLLLVSGGRSLVVTRRALVRRRLRVVVLSSLVGTDCKPSLLNVAGGRSFVVTRCALVRRRLCIVIIRLLGAKDRGPPLSLVAVRQLSVVAWAFSSSVRLLWTIAIVRRFSSPVGDCSSLLVARLSLVRCRSRVVIIPSLVVEDCYPSLLLVSGGRSLVVTRRALVRRRLRVVVRCSLVGKDCDPSLLNVA